MSLANSPIESTQEVNHPSPSSQDLLSLLERIACAQEHIATTLQQLDLTLVEAANHIGRILEVMG
ncbi:MAG: hypothetical protein RL244_1536 [Pseudomonadota bacterium]|jgi:hypothetical protein